MKQFTISEREAGQRLDKYLAKVLDRAPKSFVYKMLRKKNIVLNEKKAAGGELLQAQDVINIYLSDETFAKFASALEKKRETIAQGQMLPIVYEDTDILILNKPAGLLSQKAAPTDDCANDRMLQYLLDSGQLSKQELRTFRPSICNRLDRNTSGLLIAGKTMAGLQQMGKLLKDRTVKKYYLTIVWGRVETAAHLKGYLVKDHKTNQVRVISDASGERGKTHAHSEKLSKEKNNGMQLENASRENSIHSKKFSKEKTNWQHGKLKGEKPDWIETSYRPLRVFSDATLLEVHLITGRSHQIRAHLASVNHPIVGDPKYGDAKKNALLLAHTGQRYQLLHAARMEFPDGRVVEAPVPDAFSQVITWLEQS